MSGEIYSGVNGTTCLLYREDGVNGYVEIVGQLEMTSSVLGTAIDVSSKLDEDFIKLMSDELAGRGQNVTGTIIYSSDSEFRVMRDLADNGGVSRFKLDFTGDDADAVFFYGMPNQMADSLPVGDKVSTSITLLSLGIVGYGL